ncbi:sentrin-specific protease 2-like [Phaenicophaeus curvirostris]|uniref:sentrin-specific protease 2-like n=1 Tax=Phaenicophaeus curvirostris TaxID=33595 RepID=UPI0037F098B5
MGFKDGDVCSSQVPPRGDVTRVENTVEDGRPGQLAAAENQNGCDISGDGLYELHPASVPSRKSPTLEFEANKSPDLGKKGDDFPPITEAMEREIEAAFSHGDPSDVLSSSFKMDITRFDICTLQEAHCLNDEIIHFYLNLVSARSKKEEYPAVHGFSTFFYLKLTSGGYAAVKRWTRDVNLFEHDIVFVPVYMTYHFTLAVIDMRKKTIEYFDSAAVNRKNEICETLFKYLQEESQQKRHLELDRSEWTLRSMRSHEIPQQENGDDCGVFVCKYADYISRDRPLTFTQSHMPYFRKRMVWEIIHQQLL